MEYAVGAGLPHLGKPLEQFEPLLLALLWMELTGEDVVLPNTGSEFQSVLCCRADPTAILRYHVIGMNKIKIRSVRNILEKGRRALYMNRIPANVRDRKLRFGPVIGDLEPNHPAFHNVQALVNSELFSLGEQ